ncbi:16S rRNA (guanine(966)-N(2))-methyltransferase RsmD [Nisaea sediminum]|uniref:16S rRNA (guanine(966)-N(2))-methyltransferase RsmD n=1 Tax=Nisaea sediminum TaxID=2775867 RepID=UPI0018665490|nr:16S rRNA (guanine(966)-N(2))-methyltransferase RsmD [Nisaea sediminum]
MRIVAGKHRGTKLAAPENWTTRPTADRTRESLFGILAGGKHGDPVTDGLVVDVFAGTGALGLEALSRGAAEVFFIESDREAATALKQNIVKLRAGGDVTVIEGDVLSLHRTSPRPVTLVLMDPPYRSGLAAPALDKLHERGWIDGNTLIVIECEKGEELEVPEWLDEVEARTYGRARLNFFRPNFSVDAGKETLGET